MTNGYEAFQLFLGVGGLVLLALVALLLVVFIFALFFFASRRGGKKSSAGRLRLKKLNDKVDDHKDTVLSAVLSRKAYKTWTKAEEKKEKEHAKEREAKQEVRVFVVDFSGDLAATQVESLREQVSAVLEVARPQDEVVVRLESPGGVVHGYGLAASQLERVRARGVPLTVCVDKVAASGGYMMACIANRILAAPFAVIGSIGVVASLPNFNKVLRKLDVDYLELTAGEYKRTVGPLAEVTEKGKAKFLEHLEDTHALFKEFVSRHRPSLDVARVATGEHWFASRAL
ncbi:MAG: protease SohB [Silvanigrellales bacterium]|nr:protease SohB [Silvanigrellales bacterium]